MAAEGGPVGCGASRRRRVRRDGGIPPAGPCAATRFPGRCKHRPLHRFAMSQGCGFPFGRAFAAVCMGGPWTSRGSPRRRNFPVCRRVFRGSVGRAFTPAAPWKFQNRNVCAAAGSGGMGHPALRPPGWRWPSRLAQNIKFIRRGGIYPARGTLRRREVHGFAMPQGCDFPFGRAFAAVRRGGPWPSREPLRRRNFPVYRRVFPGSVGRAFTPAAPRQFQNRNVRTAAGSGGMGASRPTAARVAAAVPVGPKHEIDS